MSKKTIEYLRMDKPELKSRMKLSVPKDVTLVLTTLTDIPSEIICDGHLFMTNYYQDSKFCDITIYSTGSFTYGSDSICNRINGITNTVYSHAIKVFNYEIKIACFDLHGYQGKHIAKIYPLKQLDYLYEYIIGNNDNDHLLKISTLKCYYNNIPEVDHLFEKRLKQDDIKIEPATIKNNLEFIKNINFLEWNNVCKNLQAEDKEMPCYFLNLPDEIKYIIGQYFWTPNLPSLFIDDTKTSINDIFYASSIDSSEYSYFETDYSNYDFSDERSSSNNESSRNIDESSEDDSSISGLDGLFGDDSYF